MAKQVIYFDRLAAQTQRNHIKASGGNISAVEAQPAYSQEQVEARKAISEALTMTIADNLDALGAFFTPVGDKITGEGKSMKLALTLPLNPFEFVGPEDLGSVHYVTRPTTLNLTISTTDSTASGANGAVALTYTPLSPSARMAEIKARRAR